MSFPRKLIKPLIKIGMMPLLRLFRPRTVSAQFVVNVERTELSARRGERLGAADAAKLPWAGLGLSGGGIRSASLSLGVIQALAEHDLLRRFDYISSVSGGSYLAGALQWWWSKRPRQDDPNVQQAEFGFDDTDFPYGPAPIATAQEPPITERARANLNFLRAHSSYLTPGNGLTSWSMIAVLIRTVVISLLIWIPLLTALFVAALRTDYALFGLSNPLSPETWVPACAGSQCGLRYRAIFSILLYLYLAMVAGFTVAAVIFALMSRSPQGAAPARSAVFIMLIGSVGAGGLIYAAFDRFEQFDPALRIVLSLGALIVCVSLATVIAELATPRSLNPSYMLRRWLEKVLGTLFVPSLYLLAIATIPIGPYLLANDHAGKGIAGGVFSLLSGVASALYGYYTFLRNNVPSFAGQILASVGSVLYLYATFVIAYCLAVIWANPHVFGDWADKLALALDGLFVVALVLSVVPNINLVGLHRFYRDRLMEAFMPSDLAVTSGSSTYSPKADNLLISELTDPATQGKPAPVPYPLINTNAIMINDRDRKTAVRGGDNFVLSPLFVGSSVTGWQRSAAYIKTNGPLTLASAIAASGAAATASAGYIGTGITMNPAVAAVMSLLNIRLGLWIANPGRRWPMPFAAIPTFLYPGLISGIFSMWHRRQSRFIEITDGGHFENLGLYELVRRKLPIVLIVDGEADPTISLASLVSAARRIEQDFGATLIFDKAVGKGPERLVMYEEKGYPTGVRYAQSPFLVGRLKYRDGSDGTMIYIKATLIREMDFSIAGYLASNPTFPHQSTVDQFFDSDQFDAYRYLGHATALQVIDLLKLKTTMAKADDIWDLYRNS